MTEIWFFMEISSETAKVHIIKWNEEIKKLLKSSNFSPIDDQRREGKFSREKFQIENVELELLVNELNGEKFLMKFSFRGLFRELEEVLWIFHWKRNTKDGLKTFSTLIWSKVGGAKTETSFVNFLVLLTLRFYLSLSLCNFAEFMIYKLKGVRMGCWLGSLNWEWRQILWSNYRFWGSNSERKSKKFFLKMNFRNLRNLLQLRSKSSRIFSDFLIALIFKNSENPKILYKLQSFSNSENSSISTSLQWSTVKFNSLKLSKIFFRFHHFSIFCALTTFHNSHSLSYHCRWNNNSCKFTTKTSEVKEKEIDDSIMWKLIIVLSTKQDKLEGI